MKKIYFFAILLLGAITTDMHAQQNPHYTQYMYNMNVINPAYAGSKDHLSGAVLYRNQWVGIDGAPTTFSLSGSSPIGKNVGGGLSLISDKIGPVTEQNVYADFSYTLNLGGEHRLALGLKGGVTIQNTSLFSDIDSSLPVPGDPAFAENTSNTFGNFGAGAFYYTDKYYVAFSVPNMLNATYLDANGTKYGSSVQHYFLTGGYVFDLSPTVKFKPFTMIKTAAGAPTTVDLNTNFLFNEVFEAGLSYRFGDSVGAMVNYAISPALRIGYAYDYTTSALNATTQSSHEIIVLFDLNFPKKVSRSPRYF